MKIARWCKNKLALQISLRHEKASRTALATHLSVAMLNRSASIWTQTQHLANRVGCWLLVLLAWVWISVCCWEARRLWQILASLLLVVVAGVCLWVQQTPLGGKDTSELQWKWHNDTNNYDTKTFLTYNVLIGACFALGRTARLQLSIADSVLRGSFKENSNNKGNGRKKKKKAHPLAGIKPTNSPLRSTTSANETKKFKLMMI